LALKMDMRALLRKPLGPLSACGPARRSEAADGGPQLGWWQREATSSCLHTGSTLCPSFRQRPSSAGTCMSFCGETSAGTHLCCPTCHWTLHALKYKSLLPLRSTRRSPHGRGARLCRSILARPRPVQLGHLCARRHHLRDQRVPLDRGRLRRRRRPRRLFGHGRELLHSNIMMSAPVARIANRADLASHVTRKLFAVTWLGSVQVQKAMARVSRVR